MTVECHLVCLCVSDADEQKVITDAMRAWEKYTCLTFRPKTSTDQNYLKIFAGTG